MDIRLSGKDGPGYKSFGAWIRETKDRRIVLVLKFGELQISIYPFDNNQIRQLGQKLIDLSEGK